MEQRTALARLFIKDQGNSPIKLKKTVWIKQFNYSVKTLYDGLRQLEKEEGINMDNIIDRKKLNFDENGKFKTLIHQEDLTPIRKLNLLGNKSSINAPNKVDDKWKILEKNLNY